MKKEYEERLHGLLDEARSFLLSSGLLLRFGKLSAEVDHVEIILYPESFTQEFAVYFFGVDSAGESVGLDFEEGFAKSARVRLPVDMDPYDVDEEWKNDVFEISIRSWFSELHTLFPLEAKKVKWYLMFYMDASDVWDIETGELVDRPCLC